MTRPGENTLRYLMEPLAPWLTEPMVTEVIINRPGKVIIERGGNSRFEHHDVSELDFEWLDALCVLAAAYTNQDFGPFQPRGSSALPGGYRIQMARPPVCAPGTISLTIRKRAAFVPTLDWLDERGMFARLPTDRDWKTQFTNWVVESKTILVGGRTGSGKTTLTEALLRAIPLDERIITVEKTAEFTDLPHPGWLPQYYGYSETADLSEKIVEDIFRQRPDRLIFGELRSTGEAWGYLRGLKGGHGGSITTLHADSARGCMESLITMLSAHTATHMRDDHSLRDEIRQYVDVLVHCDRNPYRVTEVVELKKENT